MNFQDYHKEFLDAYCVLPLITKASHPHYYKNKLTSSVNYILAYNLLTIIDKEFQDIYHFDKAIIFNNENDICDAFRKSLDIF